MNGVNQDKQRTDSSFVGRDGTECERQLMQVFHNNRITNDSPCKDFTIVVDCLFGKAGRFGIAAACVIREFCEISARRFRGHII